MFIEYDKSTEIIVNLSAIAEEMRKAAAYIEHTINEIKKETQTP